MDAPTDLDALYRDHVHVLALMALHYPAHLAYSDPGNPTIPVLTLDTPHGQLAYHVPGADQHSALWAHVRWSDDALARDAYDGHTMAEKQDRIRRRVASFPVIVGV